MIGNTGFDIGSMVGSTLASTGTSAINSGINNATTLGTTNKNGQKNNFMSTIVPIGVGVGVIALVIWLMNKNKEKEKEKEKELATEKKPEEKNAEKEKEDKAKDEKIAELEEEIKKAKLEATKAGLKPETSVTKATQAATDNVEKLKNAQLQKQIASLKANQNAVKNQPAVTNTGTANANTGTVNTEVVSTPNVAPAETPVKMEELSSNKGTEITPQPETAQQTNQLILNAQQSEKIKTSLKAIVDSEKAKNIAKQKYNSDKSQTNKEALLKAYDNEFKKKESFLKEAKGMGITKENIGSLGLGIGGGTFTKYNEDISREGSQTKGNIIKEMNGVKGIKAQEKTTPAEKKQEFPKSANEAVQNLSKARAKAGDATKKRKDISLEISGYNSKIYSSGNRGTDPASSIEIAYYQKKVSELEKLKPKVIAEEIKAKEEELKVAKNTKQALEQMSASPYDFILEKRDAEKIIKNNEKFLKDKAKV